MAIANYIESVLYFRHHIPLLQRQNVILSYLTDRKTTNTGFHVLNTPSHRSSSMFHRIFIVRLIKSTISLVASLAVARKALSVVPQKPPTPDQCQSDCLAYSSSSSSNPGVQATYDDIRELDLEGMGIIKPDGDTSTTPSGDNQNIFNDNNKDLVPYSESPDRTLCYCPDATGNTHQATVTQGPRTTGFSLSNIGLLDVVNLLAAILPWCIPWLQGLRRSRGRKCHRHGQRSVSRGRHC